MSLMTTKINVNTSTQLVSNIFNTGGISFRHMSNKLEHMDDGVHYTYKYIRAIALVCSVSCRLVVVPNVHTCLSMSWFDMFVASNQIVEEEKTTSTKQRENETIHTFTFSNVCKHCTNRNRRKMHIHVSMMMIQPTIEIHVCFTRLEMEIYLYGADINDIWKIRQITTAARFILNDFFQFLFYRFHCMCCETKQHTTLTIDSKIPANNNDI